MAAKDALDTQPSALKNTVFEYRFHHVLTAGRCIATRRRSQRRDEDPIEIDREEEKLSDKSFPLGIRLWSLILSLLFLI